MDEAWNVLKALPGDELVQNRYRFTGQGHPFLDEKGNPTPEIKRDLVEQMRLATLHPAIDPVKLPFIQSVGGRPTNITEVSSLSPVDPTDILRYPQGFNVTGSEMGRGDSERTHQRMENKRNQDFLTDNRGRLRDYYEAKMPTLSEDEMKNLRQQAQQMPFSYEGQ